VFKQMMRILKPGMWGLLLAGCAAKTEPASPGSGEAGPATPANVRKVTLYVEGMIERQGIT